MSGSDNVCYDYENKGLSGFDSRIVSRELQSPRAGESAHGVRLCATCTGPLTAVDRRRKFCSEKCQRTAAAASLRRRQAEHRARFPQREVARQTLKNAILLGKIRRCTRCEECGEKAFTEGHHDDYAKPLFVTWLCRTCHASLEDGQHFGCGEFKEPHPAESAVTPNPRLRPTA